MKITLPVALRESPRGDIILGFVEVDVAEMPADAAVAAEYNVDVLLHGDALWTVTASATSPSGRLHAGDPPMWDLAIGDIDVETLRLMASHPLTTQATRRALRSETRVRFATDAELAGREFSEEIRKMELNADRARVSCAGFYARSLGPLRAMTPGRLKRLVWVVPSLMRNAVPAMPFLLAPLEVADAAAELRRSGMAVVDDARGAPTWLISPEKLPRPDIQGLCDEATAFQLMQFQRSRAIGETHPAVVRAVCEVREALAPRRPEGWCMDPASPHYDWPHGDSGIHPAPMPELPGILAPLLEANGVEHRVSELAFACRLRHAIAREKIPDDLAAMTF